MLTSDFDYQLPLERIAQVPMEPRHNSRLLVLNRNSGETKDSIFYEVGNFLLPGDLLVINKTRVIPARLPALKMTGGKIEVLLLKQIEPDLWECLVGGKGLRKGVKVKVISGPEAEIIEEKGGSIRIIQFLQPLSEFLATAGEMPLPPYIHTKLRDPERYQTVYASVTGSAAAPTAGLHFTPELIINLKEKGVQFASVTLHVGLDTFAPVNEESPSEHQIHTEWCELTPQVAEQINQTRASGGRVIAVGTTSVRTIESAAVKSQEAGRVVSVNGPTGLFILPGFKFQVTDAMITNFHLPRSTLLMLVSAFAGREKVLETYQKAIEKQYRFYSFGDAMLIE